MRSFCLVMILAAVSFTPHCLGNFRKARGLGKAITFFSTDLTKVLSLRSGNVVFSPVSIHMALAMILLGAKGKTAREIRTILEATRMPDLYYNYKSWLETANVNCDSQKNCQMMTQNFFWSSAQSHYEEEFLHALNSTFVPGDESFHFTSGWTQINFWTDIRGSLHSVIQEKTFPIEPVFVSAINIKLSWKFPFITRRHATMVFVTQSNKKVIPLTMRFDNNNKNILKYAYSAELKCDVVRVSFENDRFGFYFIIPLYEDGLAHAENTLARRGVSLDAVFESLQDGRGMHFELPIFAVVHKIKLEGPLHELGMHDALSSNADFTRAMPKKIKVGLVRHRILVSLSGSHLRIGSLHTDDDLKVSPKNGSHEEAPSAGAANLKQKRREVAAVGNATKNYKRSLSVPYLNKDIYASHPFLYFLRDDLNGVLLLHGRMADPQTNVVTEY